MPYLKIVPQYSLGGLGRHVPAVLKPERVFGSLGDPVPEPPPFQPPPQAYIRGSLPRTYRNKRWARTGAVAGLDRRRERQMQILTSSIPLYPSPIFSQYAPVRGLVRKVALPSWRRYPACAPGVYCNPPAYGGFGVDVKLSFVQEADPVAAFIRGLQNGLGFTSPSGTWDVTTHNRFVTYMEAVSESLGQPPRGLGAWGEKPAAVGNTAVLLMMALALPGAWANPTIRAADFAAGWGIPATSAVEMATWLSSNAQATESVGPKVIEEITVAETGKCASWLTTGFIGATALIVGGVIGYVIWGRKK